VHLALTTALPQSPSLRATLAADAAFEFAAGVALIAGARTLGAWFAFGASMSIGAGVVFLAAGVGISVLVRTPRPDAGLVRALAYANIAGGAAGWLALLVAWPWLEPQGRWLLGAASDLVILLGLLELRGLRWRAPD
jgi:hypothetical protein